MSDSSHNDPLDSFYQPEGHQPEGHQPEGHQPEGAAEHAGTTAPGGSEHAERARRQPRERRFAPAQTRRVITVLAAATALMVLGVSVAAWEGFAQIDRSLFRVDAISGDSASPTDPANYLIVGSDDRADIPRSVLHRLHAGGNSCNCTDMMMIVRVSPQRNKATIVSLPRDTVVNYPSYTDRHGQTRPPVTDRLNAAYGMGGPKLTVDTVQRLTKIKIDHYVEVNFATFVTVVDAIHGVDVCTPRPLRDKASGLDLPVGTHHLDGAASLAYVRMRKADPRGDFGRMDRQQKLVSSILDRVISSDTLLNPSRVSHLVHSVFSSLRVDQSLKATDLVTLAQKLGNLSSANVTFVDVPIANPDYRARLRGATHLASTVQWDDAAAKNMFHAIATDKEVPRNVSPAPQPDPGPTRPTVPPGKVQVQVLNASGINGLGRRTTNELRSVGFVPAGPARNAAHTGLTVTVIRYAPNAVTTARAVQAALPGSRLKPDASLGQVVEVSVGASYAGVRTPPAGDTGTPSPSPNGSKITTRSAADNICR